MKPMKPNYPPRKFSKAQAQQLVMLKLELEKAKQLYKKYDDLLQVAVSAGNLPSKVTCQNATWRIQLEDLFQTKNTAWKSVAQRRFDVVVTRIK